MGRKVYTVKGSEDGIIAVCGSLKKAKERAIEYVEQGKGDGSAEPDFEGTFLWEYIGNAGTCQIEKFILE